MKQYKILAVDDDINILNLTQAFLIQKGYDSHAETQIKKVLERIKEERYDLILLDITMPEMDGYMLCREIKSRGLNQDTPVIMLTGCSDNAALQKAFAAGASDYVLKPIQKIELLSRIANALKISESHRELKHVYQELKADLKLAAQMQALLLPPKSMNKAAFQSEVKYHPLKEIGGDIFDLQESDDQRLLFYLGDISGHGIQAALLMSAVKSCMNSLLQRMAEDHLAPFQAINTLEAEVGKIFKGGQYITLILGELNLVTGQLCLFNAGHPHPYIINAKHKTLLEGAGGMPVGLGFSQAYSAQDQVSYQLKENESILLYTDGIFERFSNTEQRVQAAFSKKIEALNSPNFSIFLDELQALVDAEFQEIEDDFTLMSIHLKAKSIYTTSAFIPEYESIELQINQINEVLNANAIREKTRFVLELGLREYFNNLVQHSVQKEPIKIKCELQAQTLTFTIVDQGPAWQPDKIKALAEIPVHAESGRGLALIKNIFDEFTLMNQGGKNIAVFRKERACHPA